ncbi:MAG: ArnT family glycosyltransferase [Chloroflexota bacterium]
MLKEWTIRPLAMPALAITTSPRGLRVLVPGSDFRGEKRPLPHRFGPGVVTRARDGLWPDALIVLACALGLRVVFAALLADTYDPDEFVVLALSRAVAHGAVPYRDFTFFHPPGILMLFRALQPIVSWWWPSARLLTLAVDTGTALMVWQIGRRLYGSRTGLAAGLIYSACPVALLSAVRVGQDPLITSLGVGGLLLLISGRSGTRTVLAGVCLGLAVMIKYPALLFLPLYLLAAPRRAMIAASTALVVVACGFFPLFHYVPAVYAQTVTWQLLHRAPTDPWHRIAVVVAFWLLLNPLSLIGALRQRHPSWALAGFAFGGLFVMTSQSYYHYFVPILPFAALLAASTVTVAFEKAPRFVIALALGTLALWGVALHAGPETFGLSPAHFSTVRHAVRVLDRSTSPGQRVVTDQFEYAYLARRPLAVDYFWNMRNTVRAETLERSLTKAQAVVVTWGVAPTYPAGFPDYLRDKGYRRVRAGSATVWLIPDHHSRAGG